MFDLINEIRQTISNNKLRTALTGLAVSWGIFMLIVLLGMSHGVMNAFTGSFMSVGNDNINVWGGMTGKAYKGYKEGRPIELEITDGDEILSRGDGKVREVYYKISADTVKISTTRDYITGYTGVYPSSRQLDDIKIVFGRFINDADILERRKMIVLHQDNATKLFDLPLDQIVGKRVNCQGLSFTVVGIYKHDFRNGSFIPFSTARMLRGYDRTVQQITVKLTGLKTVLDGMNAEANVRGTLGKVHDFDPDDRSAVWVQNRFTNYLNSLQGLSLLDMAIWVIGILTMLTGIVGVSNIMFVSVRERTHEIGIRRAIGAKPRNILTQVLTESVAITTLFGYVGVFFGILVTEMIGYMLKDAPAIKNPGVDISIAVEVTAVLIVAGAFAGLFPALKALKIKPVEALATE